jgi:transcriptional regulator with XRE-family HTH domain
MLTYRRQCCKLEVMKPRPHPLAEWRWSQRPPMTQAELGRLIGVSRSHVHHIENGRRQLSSTLLTMVSEKTGLRGEALLPDKRRRPP